MLQAGESHSGRLHRGRHDIPRWCSRRIAAISSHTPPVDSLALAHLPPYHRGLALRVFPTAIVPPDIVAKRRPACLAEKAQEDGAMEADIRPLGVVCRTRFRH